MSAFRRFLLVAALIWVPALAAETGRAVVLARVLAYDRNLAIRSGKSCDIAILYRSDRADEARILQEQFVPLAHVTLQGLPIKTTLIPWESSDSLARDLAAFGADALVIGSGLEPIAQEVQSISYILRVLTLAESTAYMPTTAIVVVPGTRPAIFVNLPVVEAQGASLGADFLQLVTVIR